MSGPSGTRRPCGPSSGAWTPWPGTWRPRWPRSCRWRECAISWTWAAPGHLRHHLCQGQSRAARHGLRSPRPHRNRPGKPRKHGLQDRIDTGWATFSRTISARANDFIWVSHILHSHSEEQCHLIIQKVVAACPGGRVAIQDFFLNPDGYTPPGPPCSGCICWPLPPPGRVFTYEEVAEWLREAGLTPRSRSRPAPSPASCWPGRSDRTASTGMSHKKGEKAEAFSPFGYLEQSILRLGSNHNFEH